VNDANNSYVIHVHEAGVGNCGVVSECSEIFPGESQSDMGE
jgi:hypothetical protein